MTDPTTLRFGLFLSQVRMDWNQVLDEFLEAEELGFSPRLAGRPPGGH